MNSEKGPTKIIKTQQTFSMPNVHLDEKNKNGTKECCQHQVINNDQKGDRVDGLVSLNQTNGSPLNRIMGQPIKGFKTIRENYILK